MDISATQNIDIVMLDLWFLRIMLVVLTFLSYIRTYGPSEPGFQ